MFYYITARPELPTDFVKKEIKLYFNRNFEFCHQPLGCEFSRPKLSQYLHRTSIFNVATLSWERKENWEGFCTQKSKLTYICNEERIHWKPLCKFMLEEVIMTNVFKTWNNTGNHTHSMSQPSIMKGTFTRKKWGVRTKLGNNSITLFEILEVTFAAGDFSDLKASQVCLLRGKEKLKYAECGKKLSTKCLHVLCNHFINTT